jgi:hypothetical protein
MATKTSAELELVLVNARLEYQRCVDGAEAARGLVNAYEDDLAKALQREGEFRGHAIARAGTEAPVVPSEAVSGWTSVKTQAQKVGAGLVETTPSKIEAPRRLIPAIPKTVAEIEAALRESLEEEKFLRASLAIHGTHDELSIQVQRDEIAYLEDDLRRAKARLASIKQGTVFSGAELRSNVKFIRAEVARQETTISFSEGGDEQDFTRQCIERSMCDVRAELKAAKPASYEKDPMQNRLEWLEADHKLVIDPSQNPDMYTKICLRVAEENTYNLEWLKAQKAELALLPASPTRQIERSYGASISR